MTDGDEYRSLLGSMGRLEGTQEAQIKSLDRIERRIAAMDESQSRALSEVHERITRHRKEMEARIVASATEAKAAVLSHVREITEQADTIEADVLTIKNATAQATGSWKTVLFICAAITSGTALLVGCADLYARMHP